MQAVYRKKRIGGLRIPTAFRFQMDMRLEAWTKDIIAHSTNHQKWSIGFWANPWEAVEQRPSSIYFRQFGRGYES